MQSSRIRSSSPEYNLKIALSDFAKLKKSQSLPYKMHLKLLYLQSKLLDHPINLQHYKQLPQYQLQSLQQCDIPSQTNLFISIVKCLSGKQNIIYFKNQKAYIKKDQTFSLWHKCYLLCDSNFIYINKKSQNNQKNYFQFNVEKLKISKKYMDLKKRICFGLLYGEKKYIIGFDQETQCERIFKTIKMLIKEKHPDSGIKIKEIQSTSDFLERQNGNKEKGQNWNKKQTTHNKKQQVSSALQKGSQQQLLLQFSQLKSNNNKNKKQLGSYQKGNKNSKKSSSVLQFEKDESYYQQQSYIQDLNRKKQQELEQNLLSQIKKQHFSHDKDYKLIKNTDLGRILVWNGGSSNVSANTNEVKLKISTILSLDSAQIDYSWLLNQYMDLKNWNIQIQQCTILKKISKNSYKYFIQFKKYSLLSLIRWCIIFVKAITINKKTYLFINSCDQLTEEEELFGSKYMGSVRTKKFDQILEICRKSQTDSKILMTTITTVDFGGYCSVGDNMNMGMLVLDNMQSFYNFVQGQLINKEYEKNYTQLFQLNRWVSQTSSQKGKNILQGNKLTSQPRNILMNQSQISSILKTPNTNRKNRKLSFNSNSQLSLDDNQESQLASSGSKTMRSNQVINTSKFASQKLKQHSNISMSKQKNNRVYSQAQKQLELDIPRNISNNNKNANTILQQSLYKQFLKQFQPFQRQTRSSDRLVELLTQQKIHQKYYLKHHFSTESNYNQQALKHPNDPQYDNWFLQKGKWKISGLELIFTNQEILNQQKNVIKFILKQLSSNVLSGKSIMNMSLPVEIFQKKSFLEKLSECYGYFPYYLKKGAQQKNIVKQITLVAQAFSLGTTICPTIQKPFNPILGQTHQCTIGGVHLYFQQISHHPPISAFYLKCDQQFQCWGNHYPNVDMGLNSAIAKNLNPMNVRFYKTNTKYTVYTQDYQIGGLMFGERTYKNSGKVLVFEEKNDVLCEMTFNGKQKKGVYQKQKKLKVGELLGGVYKVSNTFSKRFKTMNSKSFQGIKYDQKIQQLAKLSGTWMGELYIDGQKVRGLYDHAPFVPLKQLYVLPSDCVYRLDVYYKKFDNIKKSQQWKQIMENAQRKDRKLRQQNNKQNGHSNGKKH